ncbi:MAG: VCBS repeat-containing protein [Gemmatimonadetes bacterium]|nr:VCBS repeat-containing protein [Gemmatimonadota bacterium]
MFAALAAPLRSQQGGIRFETRHLYTDANEGAAIADVNRDGRPDIIAGRNWYAAPDWTPRPLRLIPDWNGYVESNGDHAFDVDGDGWVDLVAGSFNPTIVRWFRNPGREGLEKGQIWKDSVLVDTRASQNELAFMRDLDGDGVPEWVVNSWQTNAPVYAWKVIKDTAGNPTMQRLTLSEVGNRHGMGFGDVNGDGREDVLLGGGWLERPATNPFGQPWRLRADWEPVQASTPMLVRDINGDGRSDLVVGAGHAYGLRWWEQLPPKADGTTQWSRHDIDNTFSQVHALHWADLDGDGRDELITGKRKWAHGPTGDPGVNDPAVLLYFKWDQPTRRFTRHTIAEGTVGTGLQIRTADMNGDGRVDVVVAGKTGTYLLINQGRR